MPKQVYVRGHYRKVRGKSSGGGLFIVGIVLVIMGIYWISVYPVSFFIVAGIVASIGICSVILAWKNRHKQTTIQPPIAQPTIQSRYIPEHVKRFVMERDVYCCRSCGSNLYPEIDHIIPLSRGGTNHPDNLQVLCRGCNAQKGNRC